MAKSLHQEALKDLRDAVRSFVTSVDVIPSGSPRLHIAAMVLERAMVRADEALSVQVVAVPRHNDDEAP